MKCDALNKSVAGGWINPNDTSNQKIADDMAANSIFENVGGTVQFGKKSELFWIILAIVVSTVVILGSMFKSKRKKR